MVIKIGIDFDNTIVNYDNSFYQEGIKRKIFNINTPKKNSKNRLKKKLISINKEHEWTKIQGLVYGKNFDKAKPYKGSVKFINNFCKKKKFQLFIITNKTLYPIIGEKINLHNKSKKWIFKNNIFKGKNKKWIKKHVFFLKSKNEKIKKIIKLKCNYFIDDLTEILNLLPKKIKPIHFDPYKKNKKSNIKSWQDLYKKFSYEYRYFEQ